MPNLPSEGGVLPPTAVPPDLLQLLNETFARWRAAESWRFTTRAALIRTLLHRGIEAMAAELEAAEKAVTLRAKVTGKRPANRRPKGGKQPAHRRPGKPQDAEPPKTPSEE